MKPNTLLKTTPLAAVLFLASCGGGEHDHAMMDQHMAMMKADSVADAAVAAQEASVKAIFDVINTGKVDEVDNLMTENFVENQKDPAITSTGRQAVKDMFNMVRTAYPDYKQEIISMSTTGDKTYIHFHITGTNTGPWGEMPATGRTMDVMGVDVIRFENGVAAEHWGYMEEMKMMTQLGLMPEPGAEAKK